MTDVKRDAKSGTKVALVTGGAKRLGFEFAKALARAGYAIAISYRTSEAEAKAAVDFLGKETGARAEAFLVAAATRAFALVPTATSWLWHACSSARATPRCSAIPNSRRGTSSITWARSRWKSA